MKFSGIYGIWNIFLWLCETFMSCILFVLWQNSHDYEDDDDGWEDMDVAEFSDTENYESSDDESSNDEDDEFFSYLINLVQSRNWNLLYFNFFENFFILNYICNRI